MIEFDAQTGGRYTYSDDIKNLQDLALSLTEMFSECDNFIISGCNVLNDSISEGYVYINGKIRKFTGASGISSFPYYIYEVNRSENVAYANDLEKVGRKIYGCASGTSVPAKLDALTSQPPAYIKITSNGGLRLRDAFIGKYALLLNAGLGTQQIDNNVCFSNSVDVSKDVNVHRDFCVQKNGTSEIRICYDHGQFCIKSSAQSGAVHKMVFDQQNGIILYSDDTPIFAASSSGTKFKLPVVSGDANFGAIQLNTSNLYNATAAGDGGSLSINMKGYDGKAQYYRNTVIGDGKGKALLSVLGADHKVSIKSDASIDGNLVFLSATNADHNVIAWHSVSGQESARISNIETGPGYSLLILCGTGHVTVLGKDFVDIGPAIKEDGVLLHDKYLRIDDYKKSMESFAKTEGVYTISAADNKFADMKNGFRQFIKGTNTADELRKQIGALGTKDMNFVSKDLYLADIATDENAKTQIRNNIGALGAGDFQPLLYDSGWIKIPNVRIPEHDASLYARQIGNIVYIQGEIWTFLYDGVLFDIPSQIAPPAYAVCQDFIVDEVTTWRAKIAGKSRQCMYTFRVPDVYDNRIAIKSQFLLTYMI